MIKVKKLHPDAVIPSQATPTDAGFDLVATDDGVVKEGMPVHGDLYIEYGTGISIEPPEGYHVEVFPRSSISKTHLILANSIGLIDEGYRGEIKLRFRYISHSSFSTAPTLAYKKGDKIGQIVIRKTESMPFVEVDDLSDSERGGGGFGSTGQ